MAAQVHSNHFAEMPRTSGLSCSIKLKTFNQCQDDLSIWYFNAKSKSARNDKSMQTNTILDSQFQVIFFNAQSIANKLNFLHNFVKISSDYDMVFMTETWLTISYLQLHGMSSRLFNS